MPEIQDFLNVNSECSEMNYALTPTLGGYNQWICGLDHSGSQPFNYYVPILSYIDIVNNIK